MKKILIQAESYRRFAQRKCNAHYLLAERNKHKHTLLGIFVTLFSTIVGTTIFASLTKDPTSTKIQIITGLLSVCAAVLSAFITFFRFSEIAQQHKTAAGEYQGIRQSLDVFLLTYVQTSDNNFDETAIKDFKEISEKLNAIAEKAPTISDKLWNSIKDKINLTSIFEHP